MVSQGCDDFDQNGPIYILCATFLQVWHLCASEKKSENMEVKLPAVQQLYVPVESTSIQLVLFT